MARDLAPGDAYRILESRHAEIENLNTRPTGTTTDAGDLLYAVDAAGRRHLLVPLEPDRQVQEDRLSAGVQIHGSSLIDNGEQRVFADVICLLPHLNSIFEILVDEMLDEIESAENPGGILIQVLGRWRELLERARSSLLSRQRLAGLMGELLALRSLSEGGPVEADWWTGPLGHVHDIVWPGHSLEVKTTRSREHSRVEINGLEQLADTPGRSLHLVFIRLIQDPAGDLTLPMIMEGLISRGFDRFELYRRAAAIGFEPRDIDAYGHIPFQLIEMSAYLVDDHFPRLTSESLKAPLPPGLSDIGYTLDLAAIKNPALPVDESTNLMETINDQ